MTDRVPSYLQMFQSLLPSGQAWNRDRNSNLTGLLKVASVEFSKIHGRADDLLNEAHPTTTLELLEEWETEYGLPDTCTGAEDTIQERLAALVNKVTSLGGQSLQYFLDVATRLGYAITIEEFRPLVCGEARCGLGQMTEGQIITSYGTTDQEDIRFNLKVAVIEDRVTWFRCGVSECGDHLAEFANATDLECVLNQKKPAHINLIFAYVGD